ncbi:heparan-alpha-glucosaminide N-acetyltransferase domain-containing protein [Coralloluteibacterium thermophilus]|uniref:Heparan-alpha-glucosaminide N-acetyltransferase domain-containing protein n=1 Tax=Coralloluteibacterium thermophilum TaxID=2707049 RepID=A0ABV9NFD5_9GAMM
MSTATSGSDAHDARSGALASPGSRTARGNRIEAIDFARGLAVCLMILSHGVNGLLQFEQFTDWGMVPIHAITKFSASLFIMVFGIALAVAFVPKVGADDWPRRRNRLLIRGLVVLAVYKALTVVEMYALYEPEDIVEALTYQNFPSYVEILGFYAIALLWIPFFLPLWARMPVPLQWASPVVAGLASWWLLANFDFWGVPQLQALIVEHADYYTWGQLSRLPLVLAGLLVGALMLRWYRDTRTRLGLAGAIALLGVVLLAWFAARADGDLGGALLAAARNAGKHPPELTFMLFSVGGALVLLGLAIAGGELLARALRPVTLIGSDALQAFIFHILVIFVLFRDQLGYMHTVSYEYALGLTLGLIAATAAWIWLIQWVQRRWSQR